MTRKELIISVVVACIIAAVFFYKTFLYGYIPFPGDLLISEYNPWKSYSYLGYNPGSYPSKAQYFDTLRQLYPWKTLAIDGIKNGYLPLWNPYNFSGAPLLANFQSAALYPLNILYIFLTQVHAWAALVFLQVALALFFTFHYAKKIGLSFLSALYSAVAFSTSSFMIVWLEYNTVGHVILWLPLLLLSCEHLVEKFTLRWFILGVFAFTAALLAGHPQVFGYLFVFCLAYAVWKISKQATRKSVALRYMFLFIFPLGIGAIQVLPGIELVQHAARSDHAYTMLLTKILIQPWQLIMLLVPDFFGNPASRNYYLADTYVGKMIGIGSIPLLFTLYAIWQKRDRSGYAIVFLTTAIITVVLATHNPLTAVLYRFPLPFFSSSTPTLSMFLFTFSLAMLAGEGVDIFRKKQLQRKHIVHFLLPVIVLLGFIWLVVIALWQFHVFGITPEQAMISLRNVVFVSLLVAAASVIIAITGVKPAWKHSALIFLLLLSMAESFRAFQKFNPFVPETIVFPDAPVIAYLQKEAGIDRYYGYGSAAIQSNFATQFGFFSPDGYDPLYPRYYGEFIHASANGKVLDTFSNQTRSDAYIAPGFGSDGFMNNTQRLRVMDTLSVKYVLDRVENGSTEKTFPSDRFSLISEQYGWKVYENKLAAPRAFFAYGQIVYNSREEFAKHFFSRAFDPRKTVLVEKAIPAVSAPSPEAEVHVRSYTPNEVTMESVNTVSSLLYLSDTFYPGWKAFIDGKESPIYKANYAFRAVAVPAGKHTLVFAYQPASVTYGRILTVISSMTLIVFSFVIAIKRPKTFI